MSADVREPRFSPLAFRLFHAWVRGMVRRQFNAVRVDRASDLSGLAARRLVVCANHPGWWDPIACMILAHAHLPGRPGWWPMEAAQLERYGLFRRLGAFGVEPGTRRGAATFLRVAERALERGVPLWVTGEGAFRDPRRRPVRLKPGLGALATRSRGLTIVPLALELVFWNERLPEMLARFGRPVDVGDGPSRSADEWTSELELALEREMDALAERSMARDPDAFDLVHHGRRGVGGPYDTWRRLRAGLAGRPFEPAHDAARSGRRS